MLPSADRREQADLITVGQGVGIIPGDAVDKRDPHMVGGQAQMLDQLPHRRPVREFHIHPLADSQFGVIPSQSGENFDVDPDHSAASLQGGLLIGLLEYGIHHVLADAETLLPQLLYFRPENG